MTKILTTYSDRLNYAIEAAGTDQSKLARKVGVKPQAIQYLCSGGSKRSKYTQEIADALNIKAKWLGSNEGGMWLDNITNELLESFAIYKASTGQSYLVSAITDFVDEYNSHSNVVNFVGGVFIVDYDDIYKPLTNSYGNNPEIDVNHSENTFFDSGIRLSKKRDSPIEQPKSLIEKLKNGLNTIPLISWVKAGSWSETIDNFHPGDSADLIPTTAKTGKNSYALRVDGDSMEPIFAEGSIIIVDPDAPIINKSYVIVRLDDSKETTFKQYIEESGRKYLKPVNPRYPILEINEDATFCGKVIMVQMEIE